MVVYSTPLWFHSKEFYCWGKGGEAIDLENSDRRIKGKIDVDGSVKFWLDHWEGGSMTKEGSTWDFGWSLINSHHPLPLRCVPACVCVCVPRVCLRARVILMHEWFQCQRYLNGLITILMGKSVYSLHNIFSDILKYIVTPSGLQFCTVAKLKLVFFFYNLLLSR